MENDRVREIAALDLSFDTGSPDWWGHRAAEGYAFAYFDAYTGGDRTSVPLVPAVGANPLRARTAGLGAGLYGCLAPWQHSGADAIEGMRQVAGPQFAPGLNRHVIIDCEIGYDQTYGWLREEAIQEAIDAARASGFTASVYTGPGWVNWMALHYGHVPRFDAPIISARYDGQPGIGDPGFYTYGQRVVGKQYASTVIEGVSVDLNTLDADWFLGPERSDEMTAPRLILFAGFSGVYAVNASQLLHLPDERTIAAAGYTGLPREVIGPDAADYPALSSLPITFLSLAAARGAFGV